MLVVVPYVTLDSGLPAELEAQGVEAEYVDTSGPTAYWSLLAWLWSIGESFILLEQDKIPAPGLLPELWDCPAPWCSTPVAMRGVDELAPYPSLACTKFEAPLMEAHPTLMWDIGRINFGYGEREWSRLDLGISAFLGMEWDVHWHEGGRVEHRHGDVADRDTCLQ